MQQAGHVLARHAAAGAMLSNVALLGASNV